MNLFWHKLKSNRFILLLVLITLFGTLLNLSSASANPSTNYNIRIITDKSFYAKGDTVNLSIEITNLTTRTPPPLRIYIALKDKTGKTLSYRNRYITSFRAQTSSVTTSFNTKNLTISRNIYYLEVLLYERGRAVSKAKWFVIFSNSPAELVIVPYFNLQIPYRLNQEGILLDQSAIQAVLSESNVIPYLQEANRGAIPLLFSISNGTLMQLSVFSKEFIFLDKNGEKTVIEATSAVSKKSAQILELINTGIKDKRINLALAPYGDLSPELLKQADIQMLTIELIQKSTDFFSKLTGNDFAPQIIRLPAGGISKQTVDMLARSGYGALLETTNTNLKSGIFENAMLLYAIDFPKTTDTVSLLSEIIEKHISKNKPQTVVLNISKTNYPAFKDFLNNAKSFSFVKVTNKPPFQLYPLDDLKETEAFYGNFNKLAVDLIKKFKKEKTILEAFKTSFAIEQQEKDKLDEMIYNSLLPAFNPEPDYDLSFRILSDLHELTAGRFEKIKVQNSTINFTSMRGEIPLTINNETGIPAVR